MFRLHYTAKILSRSQRLPNTITAVMRLISTTAPKPNFGSHELSLATNDAMRIIEKMQGTEMVNGSGAGKSNNNSSDKWDSGIGDSPKLPTSNEKKVPEITIVDINGGYGRMDFEDRMDHMDRSDRINEAKQSNDVCREPVIPKINAVVNIDGYGDDMMYEDKADWEISAKLEVKQGKDIDNESNSNAADTTAKTKAVGGVENNQISGAELFATQAPRETCAEETGKDAVLQQVTTEGTLVMTKAVNGVENNQINGAELPPTQTPYENCAEEITKDAALQQATTEGIPTTAGSNNEAEIICEAPVDIDAFANEQESKQGTVDINAYEDDERFKLPSIPKVRNNVFEFRGIKIIMPKRMLRDATYRYRLDPSDKDKPDDIQICVFEK